MTKINTTADALDSYKVTSEQIAKVTLEGKGASVKSAHTDEEYRVEYKVLTCTCRAGQEGKGCWHRRACLAKLAILRVQKRESVEAENNRPAEEVAAESRIEELVRQGHDRATAERVVTAKPKPGSGKGKRLNYDPSFSLLK
jgi:hypothetical protein